MDGIWYLGDMSCPMTVSVALSSRRILVFGFEPIRSLNIA